MRAAQALRFHPLRSTSPVRRAGGGAVATTSLRFPDLTLEGESRAGEGTWFRVHPPGLAFDAGRGAPALAGAADLFLTHGHLDHALGAPWALSQRALQQAGPTRLGCPAAIAGELRALVESAARLADETFSFEILPLEPGARVPVGRDLTVEAFATDHVVPSLGYHLCRRRRRLAPAYRGLPGARLAELRAAGHRLEEELEELALSYCGDTGPGVFETEPRLYETGVLLIECTFLGPRQRRHGDRYKHIHLDDLVERVDHFANRALVLHHLSRRHATAELAAEVKHRLPGLAERVRVFGE